MRCGSTSGALSRHATLSERTNAQPRLLVIPPFGRPDGQKKAYVRLTSDHDALDVANKIGII